MAILASAGRRAGHLPERALASAFWSSKCRYQYSKSISNVVRPSPPSTRDCSGQLHAGIKTDAVDLIKRTSASAGHCHYAPSLPPLSTSILLLNAQALEALLPAATQLPLLPCFSKTPISCSRCTRCSDISAFLHRPPLGLHPPALRPHAPRNAYPSHFNLPAAHEPTTSFLGTNNTGMEPVSPARDNARSGAFGTCGCTKYSRTEATKETK